MTRPDTNAVVENSGQAPGTGLPAHRSGKETMNKMRVRRAVGLASVGVLAAGLTVALPATSAHAAIDERPAALGAAWLAAQPVDGLVTVKSDWEGTVSEFTDQGLSLDVAFALDAVGGHDAVVTQIRDAVAAEVAAGRYIQGDEFDWEAPYEFKQVGHYSGATAKTLAAAVELGGAPTAFGGVDLVDRLEERVTTSGRLQDDSFFGDYANVIGQSFAVRGLNQTDSTAADAVTDFLLTQQCDNGGFRLDFDRDFPSAPGKDTACTDGGQADPDATSHALSALNSLDAPSADVLEALASGVAYLLSIQHVDGSFGGGTSTEGANANSTGLAGLALGKVGEGEAATAAAVWVRSHQLSGVDACEPGSGADAGAIAYNDTDLSTAAADGIGEFERGVFVRAAAQALPLLAIAPGAEADLALTGPSKHVAAGSVTEVTVAGLAPGERACVVGGKQAVTVTGDGTAAVTLPAGTGVRTLTLATADHDTSTTVSVLGKTKLTIKAKKAKVKKGKKNTIKVAGLVAGEKVKLKLRGKKVAAGKANAKGRFTVKIKVGKKTGKAKVKATGAFKNRKGTTSFRVR